MDIKLKVQGSIISRLDDEIIHDDDKTFVKLIFSFSEEWKNKKISAVISNGTTQIVQIRNDQCEIPWELIKKGQVSVYVYTSGICTTNKAYIKVEYQKPVNMDGDLKEVIQEVNSILGNEIASVKTELSSQSREIEEVKAKVGQAVANTIDTPFQTAYWKDNITNKLYIVKVKNGVFTVEENGSSGGSDNPPSGEDLSGLEDLIPDRLLIWHDEFDGDSLDEDTWVYELGYQRNEEPQNYIREAITVADSICKITASKRAEPIIENKYGADHEMTWDSGSIKTIGKMCFKYGRIEAKIKVSGVGYEFPAFWLMGMGLPWCRCGEIDIMEMWNTSFTSATYNIHWADGSGSHKENSITSYQCTRDKWHIFACEIDSENITFYLDGNEVGKINHTSSSYVYFNEGGYTASALNPFKSTSKYVILNLAMSYNNTIVGDADRTMEIDWVRLYALPAQIEKKEIADMHFYICEWDANIATDGKRTITLSKLKKYNDKYYANISPLIYDSNGNVLFTEPISMSVESSNPEVAKVLSTVGTLQLLSTGTTDITVTVNGITKTRTLTIS